MSYRQQRNYENLNKAIYPGYGDYGIPIIAPVECSVDNWISFNFAKTCEDPEIHGVHFSLTTTSLTGCGRSRTHTLNACEDSKRYARRTSRPTRTFRARADLQPLPEALARRVLAGAWNHGHSDNQLERLFEFCWCFDGEPVGGIVAVSSVGTQNNPVSQELFITGYREMMDRLEPSKVIMYGNVPDECEGDIIRVGAFQEKWRKSK